MRRWEGEHLDSFVGLFSRHPFAAWKGNLRFKKIPKKEKKLKNKSALLIRTDCAVVFI